MDEDSRFTRLPLEIIATILTNLDQPDLLSMMCVDKRFNEIIGRTAKLSKKLVLFFGNDWDTEDKKETLLKILKSGRTFTKLEIKMLNLNLVRNEPLILFIIDIIKKFNINFERISVKNSSFYLNEFIELLKVFYKNIKLPSLKSNIIFKAMPTITSISLYHNNIGDMSYGDNNSLKLEHLTELEILATGFNITNDNYKFICDAPQLTKLTSNINELSQLIANKPNLKVI